MNLNPIIYELPSGLFFEGGGGVGRNFSEGVEWARGGRKFWLSWEVTDSYLCAGLKEERRRVKKKSSA